MSRPIIQVDEKVPFIKGLPLSFQHLFAMFGASVLVPLLFKVDPSVVLLMNGVGTLIYLLICKGRAPAFLGSSFAFLAPAGIVIAKMGYQYALGGFIAAGAVFVIVAIIIGVAGTGWIKVVLPAATMGPIVALIGLELAGTAVSSAGLLPADGNIDWNVAAVSLITLGVAFFGSIMFRKFLAAVPILIAIVVGYLVAIPFGLVNFGPVGAAPAVALPKFQLPAFDINAILVIIPASLVVISEHIGHLIVTGNIVGRDLTKDPGLHRSLMGDGLSTMLSGFVGSVPTTTYGENMGVMAITKVYSVWVIGGAAVISVILGFSGTLSAVIQSIPGPVMGGICILLFGVIASSGIRILVDQKVDYSKPKNLMLTAVVFIVGISGFQVQIGNVALKGMALATVVGMLLSLIVWGLEKAKLTNDDDQ
jgi:uracil permease